MMFIYTLIKILPWFMALLLVATWTPWRSIFEHIFGNNPYKAKCYVEAGEDIRICQGRYIGDGKHGTLYRYKYYGVWNTVIVPDNYPFRFVLGCRQIRIIAGQAVAAPLGGMSKPIVVSGNTLNAILKAHIGTELAKSVFGKGINAMQIIILVAVALFAAYFLYTNVLAPSMTPAAQTPAAQTPAATTTPGPLE